MARMTPKIEVPAPTRTALQYGLFSILSLPAASPAGGGSVEEDRWRAAGVEFTGLPCEDVLGVPGFDCDPADPAAQTIDAPEDPTPTGGEGDSFDVYGWHACGPNSISEAQTLAMRHLLAGEEKRVEKAFWTGDLGNWPNLTGGLDSETPIEVGGADLSPLAAIMELEAWAAGYGAQAVLHTSRVRAVQLIGAGVAEVKNGKLQTKLGLPIVAGAGYVDDGRIVATGAIAGKRSEPDALDPQGYTFDPRTNDVVAQARRSYVLWADPCGMYSVTLASALT